jgi:PIN like domain
VSRIYFTDRDLGKQFPRILADAGINVERHGDLFQPEGSDEQWLQHCGASGRIAISHNSRIRYVPNELEAVKRFKVALLILVGQATTAELAHNVVRTLPRIEAFLGDRSPPFIAKVYRATPAELAKFAAAPGRVELWFPKVTAAARGHAMGHSDT